MYQPSKNDNEKIEKAFTYHAPKTDQVEQFVKIRDTAKTFAEYLVTACPPSRELSLALTSLEQTVMWANAAIARSD